MYAFRDIQVSWTEELIESDALDFFKDYQSMIVLSERCAENKIIARNIQNNMRILYLTAFARSRWVDEWMSMRWKVF